MCVETVVTRQPRFLLIAAGKISITSIENPVNDRLKARVLLACCILVISVAANATTTRINYRQTNLVLGIPGLGLNLDPTGSGHGDPYFSNCQQSAVLSNNFVRGPLRGHRYIGEPGLECIRVCDSAALRQKIGRYMTDELPRLTSSGWSAK